MKKSIALLLAFVVVFSLSVSAFAATGSPAGKTESSNGTAALPVTDDFWIKLTELNKKTELTESQQKTFDEAYANLASVTPSGYIAQYFCYAVAKSYPAVATLEINNASDVVAKLYVNGQWKDLSCEVNGTKVSVTLTSEGALAIFTR